MKRIAVAVWLAVALLRPGAPGLADDLKVLSAAIMRNGLPDAGANFERMTGIKLAVTFDTAGNVKSKFEKGESADIVILQKADIDALAKAKKIAVDSVRPIARTAIAVAVRKGQPKPDISSVAAVKKTLLEAKSIAYLDPKSGAAQTAIIQRDLARLGIAKQIAAKTKLLPSGQEASEEKDADLMLNWTPAFSGSANYEVVGPLPAQLQDPERSIWAAGAAAKAADLETAKDLCRVLASPESLNAFKAKGFTPPS